MPENTPGIRNTKMNAGMALILDGRLLSRSNRK